MSSSLCLQVEVFCYALSPPDGSEWRARIEGETEHFLDVSAWAMPDIARRIAADGIQVRIKHHALMGCLMCCHCKQRGRQSTSWTSLPDIARRIAADGIQVRLEHHALMGCLMCCKSALQAEGKTEHFLDESACAMPDVARRIAADGIQARCSDMQYSTG